jgi:hypothetical protein
MLALLPDQPTHHPGVAPATLAPRATTPAAVERDTRAAPSVASPAPPAAVPLPPKPTRAGRRTKAQAAAKATVGTAAMVAPGVIEAQDVTAPAETDGRKTPGRVKLNLSYIAPLSVMKISFLVAIALGIAFVVAVFVLWEALNDKSVFTTIDQMITDLVGANRPESLQILKYVERGRIMSGAAIIAVIDVVVITVVSTLVAVIYNIIAALVGGVRVTLREH